MASLHRVNTHAAGHLTPGESVVAAVNTQPRGMWRLVAPLGGIGAAVGFVVATGGATSYLRAVLGGGIGAGIGVALGIVVAGMRFRSSAPFGGIALTLARTPERILVYRRSAATNRLGPLVSVLRLDEVRLRLEPARGFLPRPLILTLADESDLAFEVARPERPERFVGSGAAE